MTGWCKKSSKKHFLIPLLGVYCSYRCNLIFHSITFSLDKDGLAVMDQAIQDCGSDVGIVVENRGPLFEGFIGGNADGAVFIATADDLKNQIGAVFVNGHISELINNEESWFQKGFDFRLEVIGVLGGNERVEIGRAHV